jgi:hypothetical protein
VERIDIHVLCIEEAGTITNYGSDVVSPQAMEASQTLRFETQLPQNCGNLWFMTAIAEIG